MAVHFFTEDISSVAIKKNNIKKWVLSLIERENKKLGEINYIFCSDSYILTINKQFLSHNYHTDIITFDYCEENIISGDIFISIDTVEINSEKFKTTFNQEIHRVIFHGILHLVGYNDKSDSEQKIMTQKENEYLELFEIK